MILVDFATQFLERCRSAKEKPILIVLKDTRPFHTDLRGLDLSKCISILLVNNFEGDKLPEDRTRHFDFVHYFEADQFWKNIDESLATLDTVEMPQLDKIIDYLIDALKNSDPTFDVARIRIAVLQEQFLRLAAKIRQRHGIPGPKPDEVKRFTDKAVMKQVAKDGGLDTAKYFIATPSELMSNPAKMESLAAIWYPFMAKPLNGTGGAGITKIEDSEQLNAWLKSVDPNMEYMFEEYIDGDEYRFLALVQPQSILFFPVTLVIHGHSFLEGLASGLPASLVVMQDQNKCSIIQKFALQVLRVFQPSTGTIVYIQGFVTKDGTAKLNELTIRAPGTISSCTFTENTGISPESVQIMAQIRKLDLNAMAAQDEESRKLCAYVIYPEVEGTVKRLVSVPGDQVESEVKVIHSVGVGDETVPAAKIGDLAARLLVWNEDGESLASDIDWLKQNYKPVIIE